MNRKALVFPHATHNSCPTIGFDGTRFMTTTYDRPPEPLLDVWTAFLGTFSRPRGRPNVFEHTSLAPSRKALSGRPQGRPACPGPCTPSTRRRGTPYGRHSSRTAMSVRGRTERRACSLPRRKHGFPTGPARLRLGRLVGPRGARLAMPRSVDLGMWPTEGRLRCKSGVRLASV